MPELVTTLTGWSGRTAAAFFAGVTVTFAAAGSVDGVWLWSPPGVVDAPGVELDGAPPAAGLPPSVSLQAAATTSIAQIPATARPRLRTELPNTLSSPEIRCTAPASLARPAVVLTHQIATGTAGPFGPAVLMTIGTVF
ncbi:hypothetical protein GCM10027269_44180 [Kribbella endophytica]